MTDCKKLFKNKKFVLSAIIFFVIIFSTIIYLDGITADETFARCLTENKAKLYGSFACSHCKSQKVMFGDAVIYLDYVECLALDKSKMQVCKDMDIRAYPTWIFQNGTRLVGKQSLSKLSDASGCRLTTTWHFRW